MEINLTEEKSEIQVKGDSVDFAKVSFEMAEKRNVSGNAVKLFIIYYSYANWRGSGPKKLRRVAQEVLADRLGYTVTTVSTLTSELEDKGYLEIKRTGRTSIITLYFKPLIRNTSAEKHNIQQ